VAVAGGEQAIVLIFVRQGQEKSSQALAALQPLARKYPETLAVVAVIANPGEGDAAGWAAQAGVGYPVLLDAAGEAYGLYGVRVMPSTGVIRPDGTLAGTADGYTRQYAEEVEGLVRSALGLAPAAGQADAAEPAVAKSEQRTLAERNLEKAKLLLKRKMGEKAADSAEEAVAADGEYLEARLFLGDLLLDLSDDNAAKALPHYEKALALDPKSMEAKVGLARVKSIQGDTAGAVELLEQAALLNPKPEKVYFELGRVHERAGEYPEAVQAYRKALERLLR
jgi:tetratricopeptide (TPR) repeat protein